MLKLGMKPVTGVSRVTIKRTKNVSFYLVVFLDNQFLVMDRNSPKFSCSSDTVLHLKT
jgi:hypothetical protein